MCKDQKEEKNMKERSDEDFFIPEFLFEIGAAWREGMEIKELVQPPWDPNEVIYDKQD